MPVRIFQLARELEMPSKDLIAFLNTQGHRPASHMSNIDDTVAQILRDRIKPRLLKERAAKEKVAQQQAAQERAKTGATVSGEAGGKPLRAGTPLAGAKTAEATRLGKAPTRVEGERKEARPWGEGGGTEEEKRREKEKEKEKEKEVPRVKRYFPSQEDMYESGPRFGGGVRRKTFGKPKKQKSQEDEGGVAVTEKPQKVEITLPITVREFSSLTGIKAQAIITTLWQQGRTVTINHALDEDLVTMLALEHGIDIGFKQTKEADIEQTLRGFEEFQSSPEDLVSRAPVVTFMGHVDHGKTSLLDKIRKTNVVTKEAGGITQHIGAYRVDKDNVHVVFIDTPGHHAFTEMRARGAHVTDVAVLVVAADDGVMPQTEEAYSHAKAAKVPIVVAVNKVDKPTANVMRCKQQLASLGLQPVEWGGETEFVEVSALTSQGIDSLLETLSLTSELLGLKANPKRPAIGVVLEAESSPSRGPLATILVRDGTLRVRDCLLCGSTYGRVQGLWRNGVERVEEAGPSTPVTVTGLDEVPKAGDKFYVFSDLEQPKKIAEERRREKSPAKLGIVAMPRFAELVPEVRIILKTDVQGSLEAIVSAMANLSTEEVKLNTLYAQVGGISRADVTLADASHALVFGFNVGPDEQARALAEEKKVEIRRYDVIYKLLDDVKAALQGQLAPQTEEQVHGHAEIRQVFKASKIGTIAGCMVTDGFMARSDTIRLYRGGKLVYTGALDSLRRFKDDVREVKSGFDCGLKIANYEDIQVGDTVEAFTVVEKPRQL